MKTTHSKIFTTTFFIIILCTSCANKTNQKSSSMSNDFEFVLPTWAKNSNIYEVNIRQYTPEGTINAFAAHLPRLKAMGVDILWFMPVFPISDTKKKGSLGSYYAVSDFREINPKFGTKEDMKNLIKSVHDLGMKIILDWVPNHTGWDHTWIKSHPEFYTKDSLGNITDPVDDNGKSYGWTDVADLNYDNKEMRQAMIADLVYWLSEYKIDGYRMDIAFGVPLDFWHEAKVALTRVKPDIYMLAEAETPEQLNEGVFHAAYGWSFHHLINAIAKGEKSANDIDTWRLSEKSKMTQGNFMHFTCNHDENSWNGTEYERMGEGAATFAVLTTLYDGMPLIYSGQEEPLKRRLEFFEKDDIGFKNYNLADFYGKMLKAKHENQALWNLPYGGEAIRIGSSDSVYAFKREKDGNKVCVLLNLSPKTSKVTLYEDLVGKELFTGREIHSAKGSEVEMKAWEYMVVY